MAASRTLILMRHAAAGHQGAQRDHDRSLTPGGLQDAAAVGDWIRRSMPPVNAVLCSTAVRTRQTLAALRLDAPTTFAEELYGGGIDEILEQIGRLPDTADTILVVGHAPGIPATAADLATVASLHSAEHTSSADGDGAYADSAHHDSAPADSADNDDADHSGPDSLRYFSASAVAVLTTDAPWAELADRGAELVTVRHPDR